MGNSAKHYQSSTLTEKRMSKLLYIVETEVKNNILTKKVKQLEEKIEKLKRKLAKRR